MPRLKQSTSTAGNLLLFDDQGDHHSQQEQQQQQQHHNNDSVDQLSLLSGSNLMNTPLRKGSQLSSPFTSPPDEASEGAQALLLLGSDHGSPHTPQGQFF
jgi:hypothetical protein